MSIQKKYYFITCNNADYQSVPSELWNSLVAIMMFYFNDITWYKTFNYLNLSIFINLWAKFYTHFL